MKYGQRAFSKPSISPICIFRSRTGDGKRRFVHVHHQCWFEHWFSAEAQRSLPLGSPPGAGELLLSPQAAAHHAGYWLPEEGHATGADGPASTEVVGDKMTAASKISKNNIF